MKKKFLFLAVIVVFSTCLFSQSKTLYINETFDGADFPSGWEKLPWHPNPALNLITISNSNYAGGEPHELCFTHNGTTAGLWGRVLSPVIDCSNVTGSLLLEFLYQVSYVYGNEPTSVGVGTTTNNGETWNLMWLDEHTGSGNFIVSEEVESPDFNEENMRLIFLFRCDDSSPLAIRLYVDNIRLSTLVENDASLLAIEGMNEVTAQGKKEVGFKFANKGAKAITSLEASYQFEGFPKVTQVFSSLSVPPNGEHSLSFSEKTNLHLDEDYTLQVTIDKVNGQADQSPDDNSKSMNVRVYMAFADQRVVIDHFTSSTCSPCLYVNQNMQEFLKDFSEQTVITKYPTNSPGAGDPYYNPDVSLRSSFYGNISSVPTIFFNGNLLEINGNFELYYHSYSAKQTPVVDLKGNFKVEGTTVKIDFNMAAYEDINDAVLHVSVNEKHTTGNTGNNNETDFYHVMMKMIPNGNGTPINMKRYDLQHFTFEYDMASTFVEEMNDLEVTVFLQDKSSRKIYNGNYLLQRNLLENEPPRNLKLCFMTIKGMVFRASWEAPDNDKFTGYNVYVNDKKVASNITSNDEFFELPDGYSMDDINVVKVTAVYPDGVESVSIAEYIFCTEGSVKQFIENSVKIFPNPADNHITVSANQSMKAVEIYNLVGQLQKVIPLNTNNYSITIEDFNSGIYFLKIMFEDGSCANKKVVVK
ncbi:MAG: T9SS type A sorting domain-containing protein [Lentimicrobiaceae bacterium]|nr:T9SS type A sorting domain-containing protein [Lentimicrobiaceae bacterium]